MQLPIIKYRNLWFLLSGVLVAASITILLFSPPKFGIDFTGGSLMELEFQNARPAPAEVGDTLKAYGEVLAQTIGEKEMIVRMKTLDEPTHQEILGILTKKFNVINEHRFESIGPTIGNELRSKAIWSISLVLIGIALYVAYAFRKVSRPVASWKYGLITIIVGLLHDVLLPIAAFALLGRFALIEINSSFVAAILTVLGFSVHDTIVVFDRIRENLLRATGTFEEILERSVNETLARSINTSLTTIFPLIAIYLWGGESLQTFSFTLIVGILVGVYSSIFLASPLLLIFQRLGGRK
ncbi:MAG: protein translocase subunit SecF [Patescibacteria group bacterium]